MSGHRRFTAAAPRSTVRMDGSASGPQVFGTQGSRSPLINWYCLEQGIEFTQRPPRPSPHPFGQVPMLTDDDGVEVFESGAILLYLADRYDPRCATAVSRAQYTKWVVWANSCLDGVCFLEDENGRVLGTSLDRSSRTTDILEKICGEREWLVGEELSVADVAVASYLCYVPLFNPSVDLSHRPNIVGYMQRVCSRPQFLEAFGEQHTMLLRSKCSEYMEGKKKMFGLF